MACVVLTGIAVNVTRIRNTPAANSAAVMATMYRDISLSQYPHAQHDASSVLLVPAVDERRRDEKPKTKKPKNQKTKTKNKTNL